MVQKIFIHNSLISGIITLIFGILLIIFKLELIDTIMTVVGLASIALAGYRFATFLRDTSGQANRWSYLPFSIIIYTVIGILLLIFPHLWISLSEILIAILLLIVSIGKITFLVQLQLNKVHISILQYIFPVLLFIASILGICYPEKVVESFTVVLGILIALYGLSELYDYITIKQQNIRKNHGAIIIEEEIQNNDVEIINDENKQ